MVFASAARVVDIAAINLNIAVEADYYHLGNVSISLPWARQNYHDSLELWFRSAALLVVSFTVLVSVMVGKCGI